MKLKWNKNYIIYPALFLAGAIAQSSDSHPPSPAPSYTYTPSQEMIGLAQKVGINTAALTTTHAEFGAGQGAVCDPNETVGCYDPNDHSIRIYISVFTRPNEDPATTLAYEYSHYVWQMLPAEEKAKLTPAMDSWYQANKSKIDSTQSFLIKTEGGPGTANFENELHSIVCTEVKDSELDPLLLAHCTSYLPNRMALKNIY